MAKTLDVGSIPTLCLFQPHKENIMRQRTYHIKVVIDSTEVILLTPGQKAQRYLLKNLPRPILDLLQLLLVEDVEQCTLINKSLKEAPNEA